MSKASSIGTLYGIGIGPGEPDLITVKGAKLLATCPHVFAPRSRATEESLARRIAAKHIGASARVHEIVFPMTSDREDLDRHWRAAAEDVAAVLRNGEDACFLTLGDPLLYSTYIYLVRALREVLPDARVVTVPGIMALGAAAAACGFPLGEGKSPLTVVPAGDDPAAVRGALERGGTVVIMKIGRRLRTLAKLLDELGLLERSVLVSRVGLDEQRIETDMRPFLSEDSDAGYLAIILVNASRGVTK
jgi:precorrin-2/cobalt-factor-2 C20-methyltransferase